MEQENDSDNISGMVAQHKDLGGQVRAFNNERTLTGHAVCVASKRVELSRGVGLRERLSG